MTYSVLIDEKSFFSAMASTSSQQASFDMWNQSVSLPADIIHSQKFKDLVKESTREEEETMEQMNNQEKAKLVAMVKDIETLAGENALAKEKKRVANIRDLAPLLPELYRFEPDKPPPPPLPSYTASPPAVDSPRDLPIRLPTPFGLSEGSDPAGVPSENFKKKKLATPLLVFLIGIIIVEMLLGVYIKFHDAKPIGKIGMDKEQPVVGIVFDPFIPGVRYHRGIDQFVLKLSDNLQYRFQLKKPLDIDEIKNNQFYASSTDKYIAYPNSSWVCDYSRYLKQCMDMKTKTLKMKCFANLKPALHFEKEAEKLLQFMSKCLSCESNNATKGRI